MSYARLALIYGYYESLEHAHQFVSVNMTVSSCQVILFWLLVSGMAVSSHFVLAPCFKYGYNSLKYCWFCDEKLQLSCCAARDTHFCVSVCVQLSLGSS